MARRAEDPTPNTPKLSGNVQTAHGRLTIVLALKG
jgi:hypothetical protein